MRLALCQPIKIAGLAVMMSISAPASADMLSLMSRYEGMHEVRNRKALKSMLGIDPRRVPWCGAMLDFVAKKSGRKPPQGAFKASAWLRYGKPVKRASARPGDVVVVRGGRHVIVFQKWRGKKACGLSGNSSNRVQSACYGGIMGVRR